MDAASVIIIFYFLVLYEGMERANDFPKQYYFKTARSVSLAWFDSIQEPLTWASFSLLSNQAMAEEI